MGLTPTNTAAPAHSGETLLEFPDNRLLIDLCGPHDRHLARIEQALGVLGEAPAVVGGELVFGVGHEGDLVGAVLAHEVHQVVEGVALDVELGVRMVLAQPAGQALGAAESNFYAAIFAGGRSLSEWDEHVDDDMSVHVRAKDVKAKDRGHA